MLRNYAEALQQKCLKCLFNYFKGYEDSFYHANEDLFEN